MPGISTLIVAPRHKNASALNKDLYDFHMRKKWIIAFASLIFTSLVTPVNAADDKPDYSDNYVPQIKSLSLSYEQKKINNQYIVEVSFDLTVRVHRNPLSVFQIYFMGPRSSPTAPCQEWVGATTLSYGSSFYAKQGDFKIPTGLVSRVQVGDWYEEKHQFKVSNTTGWPPVNLNFAPCAGEVKPIYIEMKDLAGHGVGINGVYDSITKANQYNFNDLPLDSEQLKCEILNSNKVSAPCTHNIQWANLTMTFAGNQDKSASQIQVVDYQTLNIGLQNQITMLTSEKTGLQSQITTLSSEKSGLQTQITTLGAEKIALQNQVTTLTTEKSTLSAQITKLTAEKVALQGQLNTSNSEKVTLSGQVSTLTAANSVLTSNGADLTGKLTAANKKIASICKAKPKPKGC